MLRLLKKLAKNKALGLDGIPNEFWINTSTIIAALVASIITRILNLGEMPPDFKESLTIILKKEGKSDYTLPKSYRPIALENTLAKILEKVIANKLAKLALDYSLIP
jgi:hypothetical protein